MEIPAHRKAFGSRLRELRVARGWSSQEAFALHAGLDRTYVSGIESGRRNPTLDVAARIAGALEVPLSELFTQVTLDMGASALADAANR